MLGSASFIEIIWTLIGLIPSLLGAGTLVALIRDRKRLKNDGVNGADDIVIGTWVGVVAFLEWIVLSIVVIGVASMLIPPVAGSPRLTPGALVITIGFLFMAFGSAGGMVFVVLRRYTLRLYLRERYRVGHISELSGT